jgi:hypothetical protein
MSYYRNSTQNPLGWRPWRATLQPGGLGAFFPNTEALGAPSVMIDRDAANRGWKPPGGGLRLAPRIYYPADAAKQYTTARGQGLGDLGMNPAPRWPGGISIVGGPASASQAISAPVYTPASPTVTVGAGGGSSVYRPIISWAYGYGPAGKVPVSPAAPPTLVSAPAQPAPPATQTQPTYQAPLMPTTPTSGLPASSTGITAATAPSGASVAQTTVSATSLPGQIVPASQPTSQPYTDSSGNVWTYNASTGMWQSATATPLATSLPGQVVPTSQPVSQPYTDANGNVWTYNPATGEWTSPTAGAGNIFSSIGSWLTSSSLVSGVQNFWLVGGGAAVLILLLKKKKW